MRGSIHCHGVAKLKNDPGLCDLTSKAKDGFLAQKLLSQSESIENREDLEQKVLEGRSAEQQVSEYV